MTNPTILHLAPELAVVSAYHALARKYDRTYVVVTPQPADFAGLGIEVFAWERGESPAALATRLVARFGAASECFTTSEIFLPTLAAIRQTIAGATNAPSVYALARDKWHMKSRWQAAAVPTAAGTLFADADAAAAVTDLSYPVIVKPRTGFASCGVRKVANASELKVALKALSQINRLVLEPGQPAVSGILIEEYVEGPEFAVDTVWSAGEAHAHLVMSREPMTAATFPDTLYVCDPNLGDDRRAAIEQAVTAAGRALGITDGSSHAELRLRLIDGRYTASLIEMTPRPGAGGLFHYAFAAAYGWPTLELALLAELPSLKEALATCLATARHSSRPKTLAYYYQPLRIGHGRVRQVHGVDELLASGIAKRVDLFCRPGTLMVRPDLSLNYWAWVLGTAVDERDLARQMTVIDRTLALTFTDHY